MRVKKNKKERETLLKEMAPNAEELMSWSPISLGHGLYRALRDLGSRSQLIGQR